MKLKRILLRGALIVMCLLAVGRAEAAVDMFLSIPGIPGDATAPGYENQIVVLAWSWGASNPSTYCGNGQANLQDLAITKYTDIATTLLVAALKNNTVLPTVSLTVLPTDTGQPSERIALSNVKVTSFATGGSGGETRLTESLTFNFSQAVITYYCVGGKGTVCNTATITASPCP